MAYRDHFKAGAAAGTSHGDADLYRGQEPFGVIAQAKGGEGGCPSFGQLGSKNHAVTFVALRSLSTSPWTAVEGPAR